MKNLTTSESAGLDLASVLNFKSTNKKVAPKIATPVYNIEGTIILNNNINVEFTINDDWFTAVVSMAALKSFVGDTGLNDYCFDYEVNGEHVQDAGTYDTDTFIADYLDESIEAYLRSKRVGQNVN